jgi:type II secretory pathway predicted ATPase ExeA
MFLRYYKLREQPFGVTPDPRYLYFSPTHREALASLVYGIEARRGFMVLVAEPGMGKTSLLFHLLQGLGSTAKTVLIFQTQCTPRDFLRSLLSDVGIEESNDDLVRMQSKLNELLLRESRAGKGLVVVVDEAQNLDPSVLEILRMLSNFETPQEKLMQIILVGQPQLANNLMNPKLLQLRQRVSILTRLIPFSPEETNQYVDHRLRVGGYDFKVPLFTRRALAAIAEHSEGIPRNINNICFHALSLGCVLKQQTIDRNVILEVLNDLNFELPAAAPQTLTPAPDKMIRQRLQQTAPRKTRGSTVRRWLLRSAVATALLIASSSATLDVPREGASVSASARISPQSQANPSREILHAETRAIQVTPGETLYGICRETFGTCGYKTLKEILALNPHLANPASLRPGDVILTPSASAVKEGARSAAEQSPEPLAAKTEDR